MVIALFCLYALAAAFAIACILEMARAVVEPGYPPGWNDDPDHAKLSEDEAKAACRPFRVTVRIVASLGIVGVVAMVVMVCMKI